MVENNGLEIVRCGEADLYLLREFALAAFREAFESQNNPDDFAAYIAKAFDPEHLRSELENPASEFYLVKAGTEIVGYLKLNFPGAQTDSFGDNCLEIERIYTTSAHFGKGIGALMMAKAKDVAQAHQFGFVWLGVWEKNDRAIRFYEKLGYEVFGKHDFWMGPDLQHDLLMRLEL